ncbi:MAG: flagellar protein [Lachnospiraceae bacterium]|nr:flagellar protein [Lachnospiraceae bacterium]
MDVRNCRTCGKLFNYLSGRQICPQCKDKLEETFQEVKEYIYKNKQASMQEVSDEFNVPIKQIKDWVREERLILTDAMGEICCENCGKAIKTGRYCGECKKKIVNKLENVYRKKAPEPANDTKDARARMRFLDN